MRRVVALLSQSMPLFRHRLRLSEFTHRQCPTTDALSRSSMHLLRNSTVYTCTQSHVWATSRQIQARAWQYAFKYVRAWTSFSTPSSLRRPRSCTQLLARQLHQRGRTWHSSHRLSEVLLRRRRRRRGVARTAECRQVRANTLRAAETVRDELAPEAQRRRWFGADERRFRRQRDARVRERHLDRLLVVRARRDAVRRGNRGPRTPS
jgi:hypothetical protein